MTPNLKEENGMAEQKEPIYDEPVNPTGTLEIGMRIDFDKRQSQVIGGPWQKWEDTIGDDELKVCKRSKVPGHTGHCHWHLYVGPPLNFLDYYYINPAFAHCPPGCPE